MTGDDQAALLAYLEETVGDDLRAVDFFDRDAHESRYIRDDVRELYTDRQFEHMRIERVLNAFSSRSLEQLYEVGSFRYALRRFEDAVICYFPVGDASGVVVSIDSSAAIDLPAFGDRCLELARGG